MGALLGGSAAGRLAESLPVVQLMAKEPAAALLGSPVAFFVGRNTGGWALRMGVCWGGGSPGEGGGALGAAALLPELASPAHADWPPQL
jgi:hypothetical protein